MTELQVVDPADVLMPLSNVDAERLDKRIRLMAQTTRDNFEKVGRLLDDAKRGQIHETLGFKSWTAYVADAVGGHVQLSGDARAAMVQMLAGEGMSVRAIAAATGVSKSTVDRDLAQVSHVGTPDVDEAVSELAVPQCEMSAEQPGAAVTGLDGKTYTKPKPRPREPRQEADRQPKASSQKGAAIPETRVQISTAYRVSVDGLRRHVAGLKVMMNDPRWPNAKQRFIHRDCAMFDEFIAALQEFRAAMVDPGKKASR
ncbi:helix-turn-helix domain-containing protein [Mycobacterium seoulense]|uniref:helix-turn-helix domain-containing protein n=1 Tax=Mycobacterium seoulense TaxID=386911 RepID=UPI003CF7D5B6